MLYIMKTLGTISAFKIGNIISLIFMLAGMGSGYDIIGASMAVALITTLYGAFAANFLSAFSDKLKGKNEAKMKMP